MQLLAGLAVQPFVAAGVAFASFRFVMLDLDGRTPGGGRVDTMDAAVSVAFGVGIAAFFLAIVAVFPVFYLAKRGPISLRVALLFGLGFGNLPVLLPMALSGPGEAGFRPIIFASMIGAACAAAFWKISIRGRDFSRDEATCENEG